MFSIKETEVAFQMPKDKELYDLFKQYSRGIITLEEYTVDVMELALERGKKLNATVFKLKDTSIIHSDARKCTDINGTQILKDANFEAAMKVPELEAIFANADPSEYFNQVLAVAVHQAYVLDRIKQFINNVQ